LWRNLFGISSCFEHALYFLAFFHRSLQMRVSSDTLFGHLHQLVHALFGPCLTVLNRIQKGHILWVIYIPLGDSSWNHVIFTIYSLSLRLHR
jgi:hypothetical protein